eukprot:350110-Chlamydomonas_euryale.AAC.5
MANGGDGGHGREGLGAYKDPPTEKTRRAAILQTAGLIHAMASLQGCAISLQASATSLQASAISFQGCANPATCGLSICFICFTLQTNKAGCGPAARGLRHVQAVQCVGCAGGTHGQRTACPTGQLGRHTPGVPASHATAGVALQTCGAACAAADACWDLTCRGLLGPHLQRPAGTSPADACWDLTCRRLL